MISERLALQTWRTPDGAHNALFVLIFHYKIYMLFDQVLAIYVYLKSAA